MTARASNPALRPGRHALALGLAVLALAAVCAATPGDARVALSLAGSLHATALGASLVPRPRWREGLWVVVLAGLLSGATTALAARAGALEPTLVAGLAAAAGAGAYGHLLRLSWLPGLDARALGTLVPGCALATGAATLLALRGHLLVNVVLTLAVPWWLACSASLVRSGARRPASPLPSERPA